MTIPIDLAHRPHNSVRTNVLHCDVYLPCASTVNHKDEYVECLASIMNDISELHFSDVIFGGDLNMELDDKGDLARHLHNFIYDLQLNFVDDKTNSNDKYTYRVEATGSYSTIDHFAVSQNLYQRTNDVRIVVRGVNFSDHCQLILELAVSLSCTLSSKRLQSKSNDILSFRWDKGDCCQYYMIIYNQLNHITAPLFLLDSLSSIELTEDTVLSYISMYYQHIVSVLFKCSCACIPQKKRGFFFNFGGTKSSPC